MEVCKNERTEKHFICIEDLGEARRLLITPLGTIKPLENKFFQTPFFLEDNNSILNSIFSKKQITNYHIHMKSKEQEDMEKMEMMIEEMTPQERKELLKALQEI